MLTKTISPYQLTNLENHKYILTQTDDSFLFQDTDYLYRVFNLTAYETVYKKGYNRSPRELALIHEIEICLEQLRHHGNKRSLDFLGTGIKFIAGNPDKNDLINIETKINDIIQDNNQQSVINSKLQKEIENIQDSIGDNDFILEAILRETKELILTIDLAKNDILNTMSLNMKDLKTIMKNEKMDVPLINILEYSHFYITKTDNLIILIIEYPIIIKQCNHYDITPLAFNKGKLMLEKQISICSGFYTGVEECKDFLNRYICKIKKDDNCTIRILKQQTNTKCNIMQEENERIMEISPGNILISGTNTVNQEMMSGTYLVTHNETIKINSQIFNNYKYQIRNFIKSYQTEEFEILETYYTEKKKLEFSNIKILTNLIIPIEENPILSTFIIFISIAILILGFYIGNIILKRYQAFQQTKAERIFREMVQMEIERMNRM